MKFRVPAICAQLANIAVDIPKLDKGKTAVKGGFPLPRKIPAFFFEVVHIHHMYSLSQTTAHISQLLEQADGMYKRLVQHRNELDSLLTSLASGVQITSGRTVRASPPHD